MLGLQQAWVIVDITCKLLLHLLCMILLHLSTVNIFKTILCRKLVIAVLFLFTESKYQIWRNVLFSVSSWVVSTVSGFGLSLFSEFFLWWDCCLAFSSLGFFLLLWPWVWLSLYTVCVRRERPLFRRVLINFSLCLSKKNFSDSFTHVVMPWILEWTVKLVKADQSFQMKIRRTDLFQLNAGWYSSGAAYLINHMPLEDWIVNQL